MDSLSFLYKVSQFPRVVRNPCGIQSVSLACHSGLSVPGVGTMAGEMFGRRSCRISLMALNETAPDVSLGCC